jgi:altronate dehydratase
MQQIMGYRRADGTFGVRNYVIVISLIQCANSTATRIAQVCDVPVTTIDLGCGEFHDDENRTNLGMVRAGCNPNVYGVLLVSLGCQWTNAKQIGDEIAKSGTRVEHVCIQEVGGMTRAIELGAQLVREMEAEAAAQIREPFPVSDLVIGVYCGGSDWTSSVSGNTSVGIAADILVKNGGSFIDSGIRGMPGAENRAVELAANRKVGLQILQICDEFRHDIFVKSGQSISDVNPTPGNKAGGISTMSEKALSNSKLRGSSPIQGILQMGETVPKDHHGMWMIDNRKGGNDVYATTAIAMGGAHIILFGTGKGTPLGCATTPVVKVTGNPDTVERLGEMIDFSAADVITEGKSLQKAGEDLYELMLEIANGKVTKAEVLGDYSWATPPFGSC